MLLAMLLLGGLLLLLPKPVQAHAVPVQAEPAANTILEEAPDQLRIWFNEPIVPDLSRISLLTQAGQAIEAGAAASGDDENRSLVLVLPEMGNGTYLVSWQVLSAVDGHTTTGTYSFGVGVASLAGVAGATETSAQIDPLSAGARWLSLTGIVLLIGMFLFRPLLWLRAQPAGVPASDLIAVDNAVYKAGLRVSWVAIGLLLIAATLTLIDQVGTYDLFSENNLTVWLTTRFGWMWLARFILTLLLAALLHRLAAFPVESGDPVWIAGSVITFLLAVTASMISHSAALLADPLTATVIDLAHLVAAGIWVGGLIQLASAYLLTRPLTSQLRSTLNLQLIVQFSLLAAFAVGLLTATGSYLSSVHIATWTALLGTTYGRILLGKIALMGPLLLIAAFNLLYVKPRLRALVGADPEGAASILARFGTFLRVEAVVALLVILAAGLLTDAQRGADAPLIADDAGRAVLQQQVEDLNFTMTIEPALVGNNTFDIAVTDAEGQPVTDIAAIDVRFTFLEQSLGSDEVVPTQIDDGLYRLEGAFISLIGEWQVEVAVRRPGTYDAFAPYRLNAGLGGAIKDVQEEQSIFDSLATTSTLLSGGIIGFGLILFALIWVGVAFRAAPGRMQLAPLLLFSVLALWVGGNQLNNFFTTEFTPSKFLNNPILPDQSSILAGQERFEESCADCHGELGLGNGPAAVGLVPAPSNFTDGHTDQHSDGDLYYWIRNGKTDTAMPAFSELYSETETWHLVNYVRRLSQQRP